MSMREISREHAAEAIRVALLGQLQVDWDELIFAPLRRGGHGYSVYYSMTHFTDGQRDCVRWMEGANWADIAEREWRDWVVDTKYGPASVIIAQEDLSGWTLIWANARGVREVESAAVEASPAHVAGRSCDAACGLCDALAAWWRKGGAA